MPIYEYQCTVCAYEFEELQGMGDDPITICPKCNEKVKKLMSWNAIDVLYANKKEEYEREILPEAKKIAEKIKNGNEDTAADFFGTGK